MALIRVESEIPGKVVSIEANPGDTVAEDDAILILESMKMEIPVSAPSGGRIVEILVAIGDTIGEGDEIAVIDA